jgi:hypothetical protein
VAGARQHATAAAAALNATAAGATQHAAANGRAEQTLAAGAAQHMLQGKGSSYFPAGLLDDKLGKSLIRGAWD